MRKLLSILLLIILAFTAYCQNGFRGVETDTNNWFINRPTNAWMLWEADTNAQNFVRTVQNNSGSGGGGISTNGGSGTNNTFTSPTLTNAVITGQPLDPGWENLVNATGTMIGFGSDGTIRVSPNLGWTSLGLQGNIDTNDSDGVITNDLRQVTFTNLSNKFGGNGVALTGIVYTIFYTNAGPSFTNSSGTALTLNTNLNSGISSTNYITTVIYTNSGGASPTPTEPY